MLSCWDGNPQKRPSFDDLEKSVTPLLRSDVVQNIIDMNLPYLKKNANHAKSTETLYSEISERINGFGMEFGSTIQMNNLITV